MLYLKMVIAVYLFIREICSSIETKQYNDQKIITLSIFLTLNNTY